MTKQDFLKNNHFAFSNTILTIHALEYAPKDDSSPEAVKTIRLNNTENLSEDDMKVILVQELLLEEEYTFEPKDVNTIIEVDLEYREKHIN